MELIRISDEKIKIMLDARETARFSINPAVHAHGARGALRSLLSSSEDTRDFLGDGTLDVEMFVSRSGGCEMFLTRREASRRSAWRFDSFCDLLIAYRHFVKHDGAGTEAYISDDGRRFYLLFADTPPGVYDCGGTAASAAEILHVQEHGRCFCRNAAEMLSPLA